MTIIDEYITKLICNLPDNVTNVKEPKNIDLILDGGIFNGSYLVGALYFLKEMEKRNYIKIDRISGCSVGSIVGFLYYIDGLDLMSKLYEVVHKDFKKTYKLNLVKELKKHLCDHIPNDICEKINNKFFISYNNVKKGTKVVKSVYTDLDDIMNTIIKSCYIPYLVDDNLLYENKYVDGVNPFIFNKEPKKKILYLDLFGYDKIYNLLNVKNEKSNFHRILSGLLDIHSFFIKESNTQMCSYVNDWNFSNIYFNYLKQTIERIFIYFIYVFIFINNNISDEFKETVISKILSKISYDVFIILLENYCL
jgi:hypothetical protein